MFRYAWYRRRVQPPLVFPKRRINPVWPPGQAYRCCQDWRRFKGYGSYGMWMITIRG